jgi:hypothetical protein
MYTKNQPQPVEPHEQAAKNGVATVLSTEALHNLAGWFDVLIQMDFVQKQRNEQRKNNDDFLQDATDMPKQAG